MANSVYTYIEVESENPKVFKKLQEMFPESDDWRTQSDGMYLYNKLYGAGEEVETDEEYFTLSTESAWYYCEGVIEQLHSILSEIDEKVWVKFTFDDESSSQPLGGGAVYMGELCMNDDVFESPDQDDFDTREEWDIAYENYWELQVEKKTDLRDEAIEYLTDEYANEED